MSTDDEAWRAIVDNYGERPEVDSAPEKREQTEESAWVTAAAEERTPEPDNAPQPVTDDAEERFVPPQPPPVPATSGPRQFAWFGVIGAPAILLVVTVLRLPIPELIAYALVASFVGGFIYLAASMPRGPRDPGDDGAVV